MANRLIFETGLDGSGFERGLARLGATGAHGLKNFVIGAFGVYSIHQALTKTVASAEELITTSKRLDTSVEQLQVLRQAAKENQVEFGKLAAAFDKVNVAREKALSGGDGGKKMLSAFARLGVTEQMLRTQTAASLFTGPISQKVKSSNVADLAAPLKEIFSRGFGQLIPVLKEDFEDLEKKMRSLGSIITTEDAVALKLMNDEFGLLSNIIIVQLAPALLTLGKLLLFFSGEVAAVAAFFKALTGRGGLSRSEQNMQREYEYLSSLQNPGNEKKLMAELTRRGYHPELLDDETTGGKNTMAAARAGYEKRQEIEANSDPVVVAGKIWMESEKRYQQFEDSIKALVEASKNPRKPSLNPTEESEKPARQRKLPVDKSDALVAVGNFLGSSKNMIETLTQRQTDLMQKFLPYLPQIEANTRNRNAGDATEYPDL